MSNVKFTDHSKKVLSSMDSAKKKALTAIGLVAVEETNDYMHSHYYSPIYDTGTLIRSITSDVRDNEKVDIGASQSKVGTNIEYAGAVHEGNSRMRARPFLRDAIMDNKDKWKEVAEEYIGKEMR